MNLIRKIFRRMYFLHNIVISMLSIANPYIQWVGHNITKIQALKKAFFYCFVEKVDGDYLEFGVFEGASFISAFLSDFRVNNYKSNRRFLGFDSFEGFKITENIDKHPLFKEGNFKSDYEFTEKRIRKVIKNHAEYKIVKGRFEDVIQNKTALDFGVSKIAVVLIDCDLHTPAKIALDFIKDSLQEGAILLLDDYFAYKGNRKKGVSGAFELFKSANKNFEFRRIFDYGYGGVAFIISRIR